MSTPSTGARCSSRLATLTVSPITVDSAVVPIAPRCRRTRADPDAHRDARCRTRRRTPPAAPAARARRAPPAPDRPPVCHRRPTPPSRASPMCLSIRPPWLGDDDVQPRPDVVHHRRHQLGVHLLRHRREPADIGEQHRHLPAPRGRRVDRRRVDAAGPRRRSPPPRRARCRARPPGPRWLARVDADRTSTTLRGVPRPLQFDHTCQHDIAGGSASRCPRAVHPARRRTSRDPSVRCLEASTPGGRT